MSSVFTLFPHGCLVLVSRVFRAINLLLLVTMKTFSLADAVLNLVKGELMLAVLSPFFYEYVLLVNILQYRLVFLTLFEYPCGVSSLSFIILN